MDQTARRRIYRFVSAATVFPPLLPVTAFCCLFFGGNKKPRDCNAIPREPSQTAFTFACKSVFETDSRVNGGKARGGHLNRRQEEF